MSKHNIPALATALGTGLLVAAGLATGSGVSDDLDLKPASDPVYLEECGSCHLAYPPGLLPSASWQKVMDGLEDHFGDNAELDAETSDAIRDYLDRHAAETGFGKRAKKFADKSAPLRISETAYFRDEHDDVPMRLVRDNPEVGSFAQCDQCHQRADKGDFDDDNVRIPGYGRWDD